MFLVGGSIVLHGIPYTHQLLHYVDELVLTIPMLGDALTTTMPILINGFAGVLVGAMLLATVRILSRSKTKTT
jgi:predicted DNA repair protein MutK